MGASGEPLQCDAVSAVAVDLAPSLLVMDAPHCSAIGNVSRATDAIPGGLSQGTTLSLRVAIPL